MAPTWLRLYYAYKEILNALKTKGHCKYISLLECILSSGYLPSITLPTRLSDNSTLIDNIIYNKQRHLIFAGILENQISDHQAILINTTHRPPPHANLNI